MANQLKIKTVFQGQDHVSKVLGGIGSKGARTFKNLGKAAMSFKGIVVGALAGLSLTAAVSSFREASDELDTLRATALGVKNLDAQGLAEARATFQQMSSSRDAATESLKQLHLRVEQLRAGTGKLDALFSRQLKLATPEERAKLKAFKQELLASRGPLDALQILMSKFEGSPDAAMPFLYSSVGRSAAADVVRVMKEGGVAAFKMQLALSRERLGSGINKAADGAQAMGDAFERIKDSWNGIKFRAVSELAPKAVALADRAVTWLIMNADSIGNTLASVGEAVAKAVGWLAENLNPIINTLTDLLERLGITKGTPKATSWDQALGENQGGGLARVARVGDWFVENMPNLQVLLGAPEIGLGTVQDIGAGAGAAAGEAGTSWRNMLDLFGAARNAPVPVALSVEISAAPGVQARVTSPARNVTANVGFRTAGSLS